MTSKKSAAVLNAWASLCALGLFVAACGSGGSAPARPADTPSPPAASAPSGANGFTVQFVSTPDPPQTGRNTFEVTITGPDGAPVTDASVTAVLSMPAMPSMNMPAMRSDAPLEHVDGGRYRGAGELAMGGTWNVSVTATLQGQPLTARKLSIVAK
jgi:hypothetical protein